MTGRADASPDRQVRTLFVNSGILGHASVARLLAGIAAADAAISAVHCDLSHELTTADRVMRRLLCAAPAAALGLRSNIDLARWRQELHSGLLAARRITRLERAGARFDVLHFHPQPTAWASVGRMRRTPSVVSIDITQRLAARAARSRLERATYAPNAAWDRRVFRAAAAITVTSEWAADDLVRDLPACAERVHVLPYPVPLDGFDAAWIDERHRRACAGEAPRFLFLGGDFLRKGGATLLAAWHAAGLAGTGATLIIASDYALDADRLPHGVAHVTGIRAGTDAWLELWRHADVFVMPTRDEAFGMVFQEAAAAGLPAIGTRINAIPEIVRDGATGILLPPDDPAALVDAMRRLAAAPDLRRTLGDAARRRVEATGNPSRYRDRLGGILRAHAARGVR